MSEFVIEEGACGRGSGLYKAGLLTLPDGATYGVEEIAGLAALTERGAGPLSPLPSLLAGLRTALAASASLPMPARIAVSSVRAGLGAIEEGLVPGRSAPIAIELTMANGARILARMPEDLVALLRSDRAVALGALRRRAGGTDPASQGDLEAREVSEALTSIFRYEKRNGRLRRVARAAPSSSD